MHPRPESAILVEPIYRLAIIGEAITHISRETQTARPDNPWRRVTGFGNVVIHAYVDGDAQRIWDTATSEAPVLRRQLTPSLAAEFPEEDV
jgi:uncharacterized protein with HEPN domain